mgnify:CR=1 FL=1
MAKDGAGGKKAKTGKAGTAGKNGNGRIGKAEYYEKLAPLQLELNDVARWLQHTGKRLLVLVEGRDTAGKGGVISAIAAAGTTAPGSSA